MYGKSCCLQFRSHEAFGHRAVIGVLNGLYNLRFSFLGTSKVNNHIVEVIRAISEMPHRNPMEFSVDE